MLPTISEQADRITLVPPIPSSWLLLNDHLFDVEDAVVVLSVLLVVSFEIYSKFLLSASVSDPVVPSRNF